MITTHKYCWMAMCCMALWAHRAPALQTNLVSEDAWIVGLASSANKGSDTSLSICPIANYWIYLKFDLSSLPGIVTDAELRMTRFGGSRPEEITVYLVQNDSWSEGTLTGLNRPTPDVTGLGVGFDTGTHDRWRSAALTEIIRGEATGDGILTLMMREDPVAPIDVRSYYSKEGPQPVEDWPQLVLTTTPEAVATNWLVANVMTGKKPSFDFDAWGRIHVMGFTAFDGAISYARADAMFGPWPTQTIATGAFYGPGDLRVDPTGDVHVAWHARSKLPFRLQNPVSRCCRQVS